MGSFTGVRGVSSAGPGGFVYEVWRDGILVASVPGGPTLDTAALGYSYGVHMGAIAP